ncbi:hypothetical protein T492DRAFT_1047578 [Pavlovales sp. CCMP2436]|nr:hypothetical protein T492DRAFT_1047578 [Pavlovales sp. CCMP2436]|mmetsp:Transcript_14253/g.36258  ORF Transcript_14253/g.36258 Transcript_14253/m.36258 type:complete len:318 (-) Transcript_14253:44-997(-)
MGPGMGVWRLLLDIRQAAAGTRQMVDYAEFASRALPEQVSSSQRAPRRSCHCQARINLINPRAQPALQRCARVPAVRRAQPALQRRGHRRLQSARALREAAEHGWLACRFLRGACGALGADACAGARRLGAPRGRRAIAPEPEKARPVCRRGGLGGGGARRLGTRERDDAAGAHVAPFRSRGGLGEPFGEPLLLDCLAPRLRLSIRLGRAALELGVALAFTRLARRESSEGLSLIAHEVLWVREAGHDPCTAGLEVDLLLAPVQPPHLGHVPLVVVHRRGVRERLGSGDLAQVESLVVNAFERCPYPPPPGRKLAHR